MLFILFLLQLLILFVIFALIGKIYNLDEFIRRRECDIEWHPLRKKGVVDDH